MYMRRAGMDWNDIIKITGHKNAVTLVKQYDLKLEAPGLHAASLAIGTGHKVAQGLEAPNEQLVSRKRKSESLAIENLVFDEEMTVPTNDGDAISNESIYPIANEKSEFSIKRHSDAGEASPNTADFVSSYLKFPPNVYKTDEVMNSAGVFAGHVARGIMAGASDMFKTALASRTDSVKYEVTQKSSVQHVEVNNINCFYF